MVDRYISSDMKMENQTNAVRPDRALTVACTEDSMLVYDGLNHAPTHANNVLLTVLEERVLVLPKTGWGESYVPVHPLFRTIFTSNLVNHAGANPVQDALTDRMMTLDLDGFERDVEIGIVTERSGLKPLETALVMEPRDHKPSEAAEPAPPPVQAPPRKPGNALAAVGGTGQCPTSNSSRRSEVLPERHVSMQTANFVDLVEGTKRQMISITGMQYDMTSQSDTTEHG